VSADPVTSDQLVVRTWRPEDVPLLHEAVLDSLDHLRPWMPWIAGEPLTLAERVRLVETWARQQELGDRVFGMFVGGIAVGSCGLHPRLGPGGLEIGYWVRAGHTGRGYATRAARMLTDLCFADEAISHIEIHHDVANTASGRVPAKLGYTYVGDVTRPVQAPSETGVQSVWRARRDEWLARRDGG
jgi:RimJ/RimL family protein N-acetyltransferase